MIGEANQPTLECAVPPTHQVPQARRPRAQYSADRLAVNVLHPEHKADAESPRGGERSGLNVERGIGRQDNARPVARELVSYHAADAALLRQTSDIAVLGERCVQCQAAHGESWRIAGANRQRSLRRLEAGRIDVEDVVSSGG